MIICSWKRFRDKKLLPLIEGIVRENHEEIVETLLYKYDDLKNRLTTVENSLTTIRQDLDKISKKHLSIDLDKAVQIQFERCKIHQMSFENEEDYNEKINAIAKIFENPILQETLDSFDFEQTADSANRLGYTVGLNERKIEVNELIKDAIEMFTGLEEDVEDGKCGRRQLGRLVATKMWDEDAREPWYILNYFIEMTEN